MGYPDICRNPVRAESGVLIMFCNYCRAINPTDAVYCSACGRRTQTATESISGELAAQPVNADLQLSNSKSDEVRNEMEGPLSEVRTDAVVKLNSSSIPNQNSEHSASVTNAAPDNKTISAATSTSERSEIGKGVVCP